MENGGMRWAGREKTAGRRERNGGGQNDGRHGGGKEGRGV